MRRSPWRDSVLFHWPGGDMEGRPGQPDSMPQFWAVLAHTSDGGFWKYVELDTGNGSSTTRAPTPTRWTTGTGTPRLAAVQEELRAELQALKAEAGVTTTTLRADMPVPGPLGPDLG